MATLPPRLKAALLVAGGYALNELLEVFGIELTDHLLRMLT